MLRVELRPHAQSSPIRAGRTCLPAYEGWEIGADGTKYFVFGYMNRNWVEEIDVPIGPDNGFNIGGADQGQPTHFLPRRNRFIFRVPVPPGFSDKDELIWTLTTQGKTEKAYASLRLDYQIDDVVRASETGALGAGSSSPEIRSNKPPQVEVQGRKSLTAKVGETVQITAVVTDDGIPKRRGSGLAGAAVSNTGSRNVTVDTRINRATLPPARVTVGKNVGLHVSWYVYRGKGAGDVFTRANHVVGRHARRRQLTVGAGVGAAALAGRWQGDRVGNVLRTR